jgi:lipopolysaccharide export system permease protein
VRRCQVASFRLDNALDTSAWSRPSFRDPPIVNVPCTRLRNALLPLAVSGLGAGLCLWLVPREMAAVDALLAISPESDSRSHLLRPLILALLCFLPAIAAFVYALGSTLDRYLSRAFLSIFGVCLGALFLVWLLIDLEDNLSDLREGGSAWATAASFYFTRLPAILLLLLPYVLLLSLLYSLGKLSTDREIVAMIQTGRGLARVAAPLIAAGIFCSLACLGLNYHWAPIAEGRKDEILDTARGKLATEATDVLYHNAGERRLWMIGAFPRHFESGKPLLGVDVTVTREDGTLESRLSAKRAVWNREARSWTFEEPVLGRFVPGEPPRFEVSATPVVRHWDETPSQLVKPGLSASYLGIPELNTWLQGNAVGTHDVNPAPYLTQWHYRWALPFTCLVTVLLAVPLSIHFSRRGPGSGVVVAVFLSALMLLVTSISLSLGEAGLVRPALAAWMPNVGFSLLGIYLFHRRTTGRPIYQSVRRALFPVTD